VGPELIISSISNYLVPKIKTICFPLHAASVSWKHTGCIALDVGECSIHNYPEKGNFHIQGMCLAAHNSWLEVVLKTKLPARNRNWTLVFSVESQSLHWLTLTARHYGVLSLYGPYQWPFPVCYLMAGLTCWDACTWSVTAALLLLMVKKSVFSQNRNKTEKSRVSVRHIC